MQTEGPTDGHHVCAYPNIQIQTHTHIHTHLNIQITAAGWTGSTPSSTSGPARGSPSTARRRGSRRSGACVCMPVWTCRVCCGCGWVVRMDGIVQSTTQTPSPQPNQSTNQHQRQPTTQALLFGLRPPPRLHHEPAALLRRRGRLRHGLPHGAFARFVFMFGSRTCTSIVKIKASPGPAFDIRLTSFSDRHTITRIAHNSTSSSPSAPLLLRHHP